MENVKQLINEPYKLEIIGPYFLLSKKKLNTNLSITVKGPSKSIEKIQIFWKFYFFKTTIYTEIIFTFSNKKITIWVGAMVEKATTSPILNLLY